MNQEQENLYNFIKTLRNELNCIEVQYKGAVIRWESAPIEEPEEEEKLNKVQLSKLKEEAELKEWADELP